MYFLSKVFLLKENPALKDWLWEDLLFFTVAIRAFAIRSSAFVAFREDERRHWRTSFTESGSEIGRDLSVLYPII
jgi:hypothetical protein